MNRKRRKNKRKAKIEASSSSKSKDQSYETKIEASSSSKDQSYETMTEKVEALKATHIWVLQQMLSHERKMYADLRNLNSQLPERIKRLQQTWDMSPDNFQVFTKKMSFLGSYRRNFLQQLPLEIQEKIHENAKDLLIADLIRVQKFLFHLPNNSDLMQGLKIRQYIGLYSYRLFVEINMDESILADEFVEELFFNGFCSDIFSTTTPKFFGPEVTKWINRYRETAFHSEEEYPPLSYQIISTCPSYNYGYQPAKHHIVAEFRKRCTGLFRQSHFEELKWIGWNDKSIFQDSYYYDNFFKESSKLEILVQTPTITLWVPQKDGEWIRTGINPYEDNLEDLLYATYA